MDYPLSLPPLDVPALLRQFNLRPVKSLGQNFLVDEEALLKVLQAAGITRQDTVLEIGPGLGSITRHLAALSRRVVAVELDANLFPALRQVLKPFANAELVQGDILVLDPSKLVTEAGYLVVANIPYYITSALIRHLLEARYKPARLILTVQEEVARRICASAGDMSLLSLSVQVYGHPEIVAQIPAGAFYPPPSVNSAVLRVELYPSPLIPPASLQVFFQLCKAGFSQKRKTLRNSLSAGLALTPSSMEKLLTASGIDPMRRAETLSIPEWQLLTTVFICDPH